MKNRKRWMVVVAVVGLVALLGSCSDCGSEGDGTQGQGSGGSGQGITADEDSGSPVKTSGSSGGEGKVLLVAQSTFERAEDGGYTQPGPATLLILRQQGSRWHREVIEDDESNVFHKGMVLAEEGLEPSIVTIAGNKAALKLWRRAEKGWQSETIWEPTFGGEIDRLRDMEFADVTGDGRQEIVLATHDQGVVAVIKRTDSGWEPMELDREASIFVHEVEVGDVDGDGKAEIFATPSRPNVGKGGPQPGKVTRYQWNGESFDREVVADWERRHAKEILVTDLDGNGRPELYASLEGETEGGLCGMPGSKVVEDAEIIRIDHGQKGWTSKVAATLRGECLCRFLLGGDIDGDDANELIAATFKQGIWMFDHSDTLPLKGRLLTKETGGFEHASLLSDIDADGSSELYVADDSHGRLIRFQWEDGRLGSPEVLLTRTVPRSAMTWNLWVAEFPPAP